MKPHTSIFVDGGSRGNPGPAACAFVVKDEKGNTLHQGAKLLGHTTNNVAEYQGILLALEWLSQNRNVVTPSGSKVSFFLDSQLTTNQLNGRYKVKQRHLQELHSEIKNKINSLDLEISFVQIPREKNFSADFLLNQLLDYTL